MPALRPVPTELTTAPFTVGRALELGVSRDRLRNRSFRTPFPGVRVPSQLPDDLVTRCAAATLVLPPDAAFSHRTAARLRGWPIPGGWTDEPLDVRTGRRGLRLRGIRWHRAAFEVEQVAGVTTTLAAATWCDLAVPLGMDDLVVAGDVARRQADPAEIGRELRRRTGWPGVVAAYEALFLTDPRAESPMETRLRLVLVRAGLPRPEVGRDVVEDGIWLARPDLSYPAWRIAIEYEGDHHRTDRRQWARDKGRRRILEDHGWFVLEVIAGDVLQTPERTVQRVRALIDRRIG